MTFVQSRISFGAYQFPAAFSVDSYQLDSTLDEVKLPYQDGSATPPGTRSSKIVKVKGMLGGVGSVDSTGAYITTPDQLETEANLMDSYLESGYQQLITGATPARYLVAQKKSFSGAFEVGTSRTAVDIEVEFLAQDPRWIAVSGSTHSGTSGTLTSNGSAFTWPRFTITAAAANATISVTPPGASGAIKLALLNGIISSGSLVIDTDPRNRPNCVLLNGTPRLDLIDYLNTQNNVGDSSFFPYLNPGANTLATTNITTIVATWNDAWLF